jgi:hypothetical protein
VAEYFDFLAEYSDDPGDYSDFIKENLDCAGSSGAVHNVVLIDVYLDLENPGGSGFWWGGIDGLLGEQKGSVYEHQGAEVDGS